MKTRETKSGRKITKVNGIDVVHPHSGEVSRAIAWTRIKRFFGEESQVEKRGTVYLKDSNYNISVDSYSQLSISEMKEMEKEQNREYRWRKRNE